MSAGTGLFFLVVGAILAFALSPDTVSFVDITMVGYILMLAGGLTFLIGLVLIFKKRKRVTVSRSGVGSDGVAVNERESRSGL